MTVGKCTGTMVVAPLTLQDCAQAAHLHQEAFYKGWTAEDFQNFLKDPLVFGMKVEFTPYPALRATLSHKGRGKTTLSLPLWERSRMSFANERVRSNILPAFILWREIVDEAEILTLVVDSLSQHKGVGTLLLNTLLEHLKEKEITKLFLEVAEDNEKAKSFYLKNGFQLIGKRPQYYERPHNTYVDGLSFCRVVNNV